MTAWRVIITDTETMSGVAPTCPNQDDYTKHSTGDGYMQEPADVNGVYDCCPGPHIECWDEHAAKRVSQLLTYVDAKEWS